MARKKRAVEIIEVQATSVPAVVTNNPFAGSLVDAWIGFVDKPKSETTYRRCLKQLLTYFVDNGINQPARADLQRWVACLKETKKPSTVNLYLRVAKMFFRFLAQQGLYSNIADNLNGATDSDDPKKAALSSEQVGLLLNGIKGDSVLSKRNRALIALMVSTGVRTIEIERATVGDLYKNSGVLFLRIWGKGRDAADKVVRIAPQVERLIQDYLDARGNDAPTAPLFTSESRSNRGERLSRQSIRKLVKKLLRATGIAGGKDDKNDRDYSAHGLRTTAAVAMLKAGASLLQVKQTLRHVNVETTARYLRALERLENDAECRAADALLGGVA